jgi:hypothetical protein
MEGKLETYVSAAKKVLSYLWVFSENSKSAYKAWSILRPLLERALKQYKEEPLSEIPVEAPEPRSWTKDEDQR